MLNIVADRRISAPLRAALVAVLVLAGVVVTAERAHAGMETVSANVNSGGGWTYYATIRYNESNSINVQPSNLIRANPVEDSYLALRVIRQKDNVMMGAQSWNNTYDLRFIVPLNSWSYSGWKIAACCKLNTTDLSWTAHFVY